MDERMAEVQQMIVASSTPSDIFQDLSWKRRREVFFALPENVRKQLVTNMTRKQLRGFVRRLDPDEATDVLGYAPEENSESRRVR